MLYSLKPQESCMVEQECEHVPVNKLTEEDAISFVDERLSGDWGYSELSFDYASDIGELQLAVGSNMQREGLEDSLSSKNLDVEFYYTIDPMKRDAGMSNVSLSIIARCECVETEKFEGARVEATLYKLQDELVRRRV